jgi:hypothetical protein
LCATAATAQQGGAAVQSLAGQWRGVYNGITISIVIEPNGQYSQTLQAGKVVTQQSGPYRLAAPNTIIFSVADWAPRTQQIYHPVGTGGYYTQEPVAKPGGATDTYVFRGANTLILTDQVTHGAIAMTRVP